MTPTLLEVYRQLLKTANLTVTADNMISGTILAETEPVLVEGKRLVLPTPEFQAMDKSEIVLFHPLSEMITRGKSPVLEKFRSLLIYRFNEVASGHIVKLLRIAVEKENHKHLTPDQSEFLSLVKHADQSTRDLASKVLDAMEVGQTARQIVTLFLKKTGLVAGKSHKRVGVVSFPLYEELKKPEHDIWGIKCRVKDKETLAALLEFIFPRIGEAQAYDRGTDSDIAPNLHALMQASLGIIQALNDITEKFESQISTPEVPASVHLIDADWQETFMNLGMMQAQIWRVPPQAGNEGVPWDEPEPAASTTQAPQPADHAPRPVAASAPGVHVPPARVSLDEVMARGASAAQSQAQPQPQPQPPQSDLRYTDRGLDFSSVIRSNPALASVEPFAPVQPPPPPQTSEWAQRATLALNRQSVYPGNYPSNYPGTYPAAWPGNPTGPGPYGGAPGTRRGLI
ncbi:hypothetical protein HDG34_003294 [Paraburkholderia sp. HC6.4b]|uniref:hypothetical protein n=1 Tax=unclassified Paraburkholderia TaxID=2615204 RepID=UPI00161E4436|nr:MULTISPECIES: hypothetical protein [unclassified Paraburkholderia]MBB5409353.1 hypothetical protein [Paraburkholderia sp. HC6.4b]MBB5451081.1 hypothetical protein [Paraburkholderia sp. Kb1A]